MSSSLTLQILFYLTSFYFGVFSLLEFICLLFKGTHFEYPEGGLWIDITVLILMICIETVRILEGQKGNLTGTQGKVSVVISMAMCAPAVLSVLYFILWQHFVLRLEFILCIIQIILQISQFFLSFGVLADDKLGFKD